MRGVGGILLEVLRFVLYAGVHVLLISRLSLFDVGWCFFYLGFLLFLPIAVPIVPLLLISFGTGFLMDLFYDTGGVHAATAVLLATCVLGF